MRSIIYRLRLGVIMIPIVLSARLIGAEVIMPPTKIPFAKDVIIDKYAQGHPLTLFKHEGKWEINKLNNKLSIIGTSKEMPVYLISYDKLTRKSKSFKLDFKIEYRDREYGFIYGTIGVIVRDNKMYSALFDSKSNTLKISPENNKTVNLTTHEGFNTVDINTGYDQTGGTSRVCVIYINGSGLTFNDPDIDSYFGIYIGPNNSITVNNIRWSIGSK